MSDILSYGNNNLEDHSISKCESMGVNILQFGKRRILVVFATAAVIAIISATLSIHAVLDGGIWGDGSQNDSIKPALVITSFSSSNFAIDGTRTLTLTGTASDNNGLASVEVMNDIDGKFVLAEPTSGSWSNWTLEMTLPRGADNITARVLDLKGNEGFATLSIQKPSDAGQENGEVDGNAGEGNGNIDETDEDSTPIVVIPDSLILSVTDDTNNRVSYGSTINSKSITFLLSSHAQDAGAGAISFDVSIDNRSFSRITNNPLTISDLDFGTHTFVARAIQVSTNTTDPTPAAFTWKVTPPMPSSQNALIQIESVDSNGIPFGGIYTTIRTPESGTVFTGYTPIFYVGNKSTIYSVTMHDFENHYFNHWYDGTTSRSLTFGLNRQDEVMIAATYGNVPNVLGPFGPEVKRSTGLYVPLYSKPDLAVQGGMWNSIIEAKERHPQVPFLITINPASGPGQERDLIYVNAIGELRRAGIENILGYVPTDYASEKKGRTLADLKNMIDSYRTWYPQVNGIMFDEVSSSISKKEFYKELVNYAKSTGLTTVRGNPGTEIGEGYLEIFDNLSIYENNVLPNFRTLVTSTYYPEYQKAKFSFVVSGIAELDPKYLIAARDYVGYVYINDDNGIAVGQNPYDSVSKYFEDLVSLLDISDI